jgi:hypothetical protein
MLFAQSLQDPLRRVPLSAWPALRGTFGLMAHPYAYPFVAEMFVIRV